MAIASVELSISEYRKISYSVTILNWGKAFEAEATDPPREDGKPFFPVLLVSHLKLTHRQRGIFYKLIQLGMAKAKESGSFECVSSEAGTGSAHFKECMVVYRDLGLLQFTETVTVPTKKVLKVEPTPSQTTVKKEGRVWIVRRTNKSAKEQAPGIAS